MYRLVNPTFFRGETLNKDTPILVPEDYVSKEASGVKIGVPIRGKKSRVPRGLHSIRRARTGAPRPSGLRADGGRHRVFAP